jgi:hypothetical protein
VADVTSLPFQYGTLLRVLTSRGPMEPADASAVTRRLALLFGFLPVEALHAGVLALDERLFPLDDVAVDAPVFVIGPPRSGTTFLHRLLAKDERFTTYKLWQIAFPSLTMQKPIRRLGRLDRRIGQPIHRAVAALQDRAVGWADGMHELRLEQPEEDEALLMHAFATEMLAVPFPVPQALIDYRRFDRIPDDRRRRIMAFYRRCVQRHLLQEPGKRFLSKNPSFSYKVGSLRETFPDGRFVTLVRHPAESISSLLSLLDAMRGTVGIDWGERRERDRQEVLDYMAEGYAGAIQGVDAMPEGQGMVVRYDDLVASPRKTVTRIYDQLGIDMTDAYAAVLAHEEERAAGYKSSHKHDLEAMGLSHAAVEARLGFVYDRFGYPRRA